MNVPQHMAVDAAARTLTLQWDVARVQTLDHATLRTACPCSTCRRVRLAGAAVPATKDIAIVDVQPMGYGVQLVFSDGHAQGIFPWAYLETLVTNQRVDTGEKRPA
ncbi:gamma-butyrobetaine hydroxylase-like domain-containing protein [Paraburkholderia megapolitana]|uniref:gamma-butyrobetaine hydroxylase-like domain-containing protein n=1 Tax=Paraburkholderia megapolitana TaxID=420953 RepID=UPI0038B85FF1